MKTFMYHHKIYETDSSGFLLDFNKWDRDFAEGAARRLKIPIGLGREHWDVIYFIRDTLQKTGRCPTIFETAKNTGLQWRDIEKLFSTGYLQGALLLAGGTCVQGSEKRQQL